MDLTEIRVISFVTLTVKHAVDLMDPLLNVTMAFMEVSVIYHVVLDVTIQHVKNLMVGVNVNLVTTR